MTLKSKRFHVYCDDSEFDQLTKKAQLHNLSISRYLVECGLSDNAYLSPHLRKRIDQIKYETKLLQDHVDLLLNKKSYLEQLLSVGELHNFIFFLTSAAKRLHNIFLDDKNQADINQFDKLSNNQFDNNQTNSNHIGKSNQIDNTNQMGSNHIGEVNSSSSERLSNNDSSKDSNGSNSSSSSFESKRFSDSQLKNENNNTQNDEIKIDTDEVKIGEIKTIKSNSSYSAPISIATLECYVEENVEVVWGFTSATNFFFFYHHECEPTLPTDIKDINTTNLDDKILANCISSEPSAYASGDSGDSADSSGVVHNPVATVVATLPINSTNGNQLTLSDSNLDNSLLPNLSNQPISSNLSDLIDKTSTSTQLVNKNFINDNLVSQNLINDNSINESLESLESLSSQSSMAENLDHNILIVENSESTTATTDSNSGLETENLNQLNIASTIDAHTPITYSSLSPDNSNQLNMASLISDSSRPNTQLNQLNIPSLINASSTTTTATTELNQLNIASPISISCNERSNNEHNDSREDIFNHSKYNNHSNACDEPSSSPLDGELDGEFVETQFYVVDDGSIDPNLLVYLPVDNSYYEESEELQELEENKLLDNSPLSISEPNTHSLEAPTANLDTPTQEHLQETFSKNLPKNLPKTLSDEPYQEDEDEDFLTQTEEQFNAEWDRIYKLIQQTDFSSLDLNSPVILPIPTDIDDRFDSTSLDSLDNSDNLNPLDPLDKQVSASDNNIITGNTDNTDNNPSSSSQPYVAAPTNKDFP